MGFSSLRSAALALAFAHAPTLATTVIENARVVDVASGTAFDAAEVRIEGERIVAVGAAGSDEAVTVRIDARGKYLVPGYWDMHAHVNQPGLGERWLLPQFLASGVTGVRDMAGDCWSSGCDANIAFMHRVRRQVDQGEIPGPRLVAIASDAVSGPREWQEGLPRWATPANASDAKRVVREAQRRGVDLIKIYDALPRPAYFALLREARAVSLPVAGHVPLGVSTIEAIEAGQQTIDHARHPLLDCSAFTRTFHDVFERWAGGESERIYRNWADDAHPGSNLGSFYQPILALYDAKRCRHVIDAFARSRTYYVPTLITRKFEALADDASFSDDARLASVPAALRRSWYEDAGRLRERFAGASAEKRAYVDFYERALALTGEMHRAGVQILVGTDTPDSYCFPGSGYHDEMLELRKAGLSNAAILRAATLDAASLLGMQDRFGSVSVGKAADLVLLDGNPLEAIENAGRIAGVIVRGRFHDRNQLDQLQADAVAYARAQP